MNNLAKKKEENSAVRRLHIGFQGLPMVPAASNLHFSISIIRAFLVSIEIEY